MVIESKPAGYSLLCKRVDAFHIGLQQVILVFDPVFDEILELLHLYLHNDLVYIWVVARAVAFVGKVAGQAMRIVSRHPIR